MASKADIHEFLAQESLAIAGASRNQKKFGNMVYLDMRTKGYKVYAINPNSDKIEGDAAYPNLAALPAPVGGLVIVTPPAVTEELVKQAAQAGIKRIWMQQGAESAAALDFCKKNGITVVANECIMMYLPDPAWFHKAHKFFKDLLGGAPK